MPVLKKDYLANLEYDTVKMAYCQLAIENHFNTLQGHNDEIDMRIGDKKEKALPS